MDPKAAQELVDDHRRAAVEWERAYQAWSSTDPGTADASVAADRLWRVMRDADSLEDRLLAALVR